MEMVSLGYTQENFAILLTMNTLNCLKGFKNVNCKTYNNSNNKIMKSTYVLTQV